MSTPHPATQAGALQAVGRKPLNDTQIAALRSSVPDGDFMDEEQQAAFTCGIEAAERHHGIGIAATQPNAAPAAEVVAWLNFPVITKDGNFVGHGEPELSTKRFSYGYDWDKAQPLYRAAPGAATDAREQETGDSRRDWDRVLSFAKKITALMDSTECAVSSVSGYAHDAGERAAWIERIARKHLASRSEAPEARPNAAGQEQGWMPIATAPNDDSKFLVGGFDEMGKFHQTISHNENPGVHARRGWNHRNGPLNVRVTHWKPLDAPPLEAVGSSGMTADHAQGDKA